MVRFLLENSLGAWWAARHPQSPLLEEWEYRRRRDDGTPAAGAFDGWPTTAAEITVMDPCMGSGHFLVAAGEMLRRMRLEEEGLTAAAAAEAVLQDNLFGLELDPRCTQLGAFALTFDAWKAAGGYRPLPVPNIACSGIAVKGQLEDWRRLAGSDTNLRIALGRLYELFQDAPELGSLIDPRSAARNDLLNVDPDRLLTALDQALRMETEDPAAAVFGAAAQGTAKAGRLLAGRYWLVATNPPYLSRSKHGLVLQAYLDASMPLSKGDLATAFVERCVALLGESGSAALVLPQNWVSLGSFKAFRQSLLTSIHWACLALLGPAAFDDMNWWAANTMLSMFVKTHPDEHAAMVMFDARAGKGASTKAASLLTCSMVIVPQASQLANPDHRIVFGAPRAGLPLLSEYAEGLQGISPADAPRYSIFFWEVQAIEGSWRLWQSNADLTVFYAGREHLIRWDDSLREAVRAGRAYVRGEAVWGKPGVAVRSIGSLPATIYTGEMFDTNVAVIAVRDPALVPAVWAYVTSSEYPTEVRLLDPKLNVTNATLVKVPFDLAYWTKVAAEQYPDGLPEPHSDDPTQWLFSGNIVGSAAPLQVAVARLLGYRWPDQEPDALDAFTDPDGIVCLPAVGEAPADDRLDKLLAAAYGSAWSNAKRADLLMAAGAKATTLDAWLRDEFFEQHARQFHNRPFIWHVWDGRKDGFSALIHYHRLDRATLEKLTYAQLGDWLERQRAGVKAGETGADSRLKAAQDLQAKLAAILEGEPPHDVYVRWKPLASQPIGWEPDLDDGVRLNIRPLVVAGVLRAKFTVNWNKDRGTDPGGSERLNDRHFTVAEKRAAREERR